MNSVISRESSTTKSKAWRKKNVQTANQVFQNTVVPCLVATIPSVVNEENKDISWVRWRGVHYIYGPFKRSYNNQS